METDISSAQLAEALFDAIRAQPGLLNSDVPFTDAMPVHEAAARDAIFAWATGATPELSHLPAEVRALTTALLMDFMGKLMSDHPGFAHRRWMVPRDAPKPTQAKHAIAAWLRQSSTHPADRH